MAMDHFSLSLAAVAGEMARSVSAHRLLAASRPDMAQLPAVPGPVGTVVDVVELVEPPGVVVVVVDVVVAVGRVVVVAPGIHQPGRPQPAASTANPVATTATRP